MVAPGHQLCDSYERMNHSPSFAIASPAPPSRGASTRASLMTAGTQLFARRGFDGTSVREIAAAAAVNLGAVSYHFGSKRGLYDEILQQALGPLVDRIAATAHGPGTPIERVEMIVSVFFDHLAGTPELPRLLLQEVAAGKPPPETVVAILRRNVSNLQAVLQEGWQDGSIRRAHPLLAAMSIVSQPVYMSIMAPILNAVGGVDLRDPDTRDEVTRHVKTFVRAGLSPRGELGS